MPSYYAKCKKCGNIFPYFSSISNRNEPVDCKCGSKAIRNVEAELAPRKLFKLISENPRISRSLGVSETQIDEARKRHPGTEWVKKGYSYLPIVRSRHHKKQLMREAGMVEYDSKNFN